MKPTIRYIDGLEVDGLQDLGETLIKVNRSAAVVKGGRRFSFSALSVTGDKKGIVGYGFGKSRQVPGAIDKAARDGRKHLMRVPISKTVASRSERFCRQWPSSPKFSANGVPVKVGLRGHLLWITGTSGEPSKSVV